MKRFWQTKIYQFQGETKMRQTFCVLAATVVIAFVSIGNTFAQDKARAYYQKGKMTEISDLLAGEDQEGCTLLTGTKPYGGTVTAVQFKSGKQIDNFTLKTAKGNVKIYLHTRLYTERLSRKDANALPGLIAKGSRITVDAYRCGNRIIASYILAGIKLDRLG